jgi:hypothetical protein
LERESYVADNERQTAYFSEGVISGLDKEGSYSLRQRGRPMVESEDVFVPALRTGNQS